MIQFLHHLWSVTLELAPWLLMGAALSGVIHVILPHDFVRRHLTGRGSILKAVVLGVPLPLCSCGVIPAGLGLKKDGASDGAAVGFLISTPQTGVDSVLVSAAFLGWPFAIFKLAAAAVTGLVGGALTARFGGPRQAIDGSTETGLDEVDSSWTSGLTHADDLIQSIWGWLAIGILVSAAITTFLPANALASWTAWGPVVTMLGVLVVSLPLYVCATASVPIAASLVAGGMPTGAALVFLMAGPATNVATIGAILKGFGRRILVLYMGTIIVGSVGLGILFDTWFSSTLTGAGTHGEHASWWAIASALVLAGLLLRYALSDAKRWLNARQMSGAQAESITIGVEGMTCGGCVSRLERELHATEGITMASVNLDPGQATVVGSVDAEAVARIVAAAGFKPVT